MKKGYTLLELVVVLAILALLFGLAVPAWRAFERKSAEEQAAQEILNTLRLAQQRSVASEQGEQYGVFFDESSQSHVLFQGSSYASRNSSEDETHALPNNVTYEDISFAGGDEVVFKKITGETDQAGYVILASSSEGSRVYAEATGALGKEATASASDAERIADSRHVHVSYSRIIETSSESLELVFAPGEADETTQTISFSGNMDSGQLVWEGTVLVGGEEQKVHVRTHRLNDPDTQFSIRRDRRFNTKALQVKSSEESSDIISYDPAGETTQGLSAFVSAPEWQ